MNSIFKGLAGAALVFSATFAVAQAASLTSDQVSAILNLLKSFGAEQSVITNVETSLTGGTPSGSGSGSNTGTNDDMRKRMASSTPGIPGKGENRSAVAKCVLLNRTLAQGSQGDDVKSFQQMLKDEGKFDGTPTGFFGPMTTKALAMWQEHHGIASSTNGGVAGMMTRKFLERRCPPPIKPAATSTAQ